MKGREEGRKEGMSDALQHLKKERRGTKNIIVKKKQNKKDFQRRV